MIISSRTPEGEPNRCSVCGSAVCIDPSRPVGDAPCPHCGHLLWFSGDPIARVDFEVGHRFDQIAADQLSRIGRVSSHSRLMMNFENVTFLSSDAITKLVVLNRTLRSGGGRLVIYNVGPNVMEVFKITKLNKLFKIAESEQEALARLNKKSWFG